MNRNRTITFILKGFCVHLVAIFLRTDATIGGIHLSIKVKVCFVHPQNVQWLRVTNRHSHEKLQRECFYSVQVVQFQLLNGLDFSTGKSSELYALHVGPWSRNYQGTWNMTLTVPWGDYVHASMTNVAKSSMAAPLFPLTWKMPFCPVRSKFTIMSLKVHYKIGPLHSFFRRRHSLTTATAFFPLR